MKKISFIALATAALAFSSSVQAGTLQDVQSRGELRCVVTISLPGFAAPDANGEWQGFDVSFCRAVAAAVLGDPEKTRFVPTTSSNRFTVLGSGEGDILFRNTTETLSRDTDLKMNFLPVNYYDGQGFITRKDLGIKSATELSGASICVQTGTTTELNLADYMKANNIDYETVPIATQDEGNATYIAGRCDVITTDASGLASYRAGFEKPSDHVILPEIISKEPLGGAVRHGDDQWYDIGKWVVLALIAAEELGVTQSNVKSKAAKAGKDVNVNRLLGTEGNMGEFLGLSNDWAVKAISAVGNYGEIFERNLGKSTALKLERGLNAQWKDGGLLYAAPIR